MPSKKVVMKCKGAAEINLEDLIPFQGNLKHLPIKNAAKLRQEILDLGFSEPVGVWIKGKKNYIISGHQRVTVLRSLAEEGYEIPPIPVNTIEAENVKEAKHKILALTSQYGSVQTDGLIQLAEEAELSLEQVEERFCFPELDEVKLDAGGEREVAFTASDKTKKVTTCPQCGHKFSKE